MTVTLGSTVLDPSLCISDLKFKRRDAVLGEMVERAHRAGVLTDPEVLREALAARERAGTAAIGKGVAIVSARSIAVLDRRLVVGRTSRGVDWPAPDGVPIQLILLALSPSEASESAHLAFLERVAAAVRLQRQRQKLFDAESFGPAAAALLREVAA